ncbi:MAG: hypothetical protein KF745_11900 [Phycisphaeraceae bacterium]|nr:hypothetical protein [Phycisphaeraceae bacterium]
MSTDTSASGGSLGAEWVVESLDTTNVPPLTVNHFWLYGLAQYVLRARPLSEPSISESMRPTVDGP